jgi:hypothetical protein
MAHRVLGAMDSGVAAIIGAAVGAFGGGGAQMLQQRQQATAARQNRQHALLDDALVAFTRARRIIAARYELAGKGFAVDSAEFSRNEEQYGPSVEAVWVAVVRVATEFGADSALDQAAQSLADRLTEYGKLAGNHDEVRAVAESGELLKAHTAVVVAQRTFSEAVRDAVS